MRRDARGRAARALFGAALAALVVVLAGCGKRGWLETYVNQGESTRVRPLLVNGLQRVPRVLLREDSEPHRTDMQIYRVNDRFDRVTLWHTGHKIARTVEDADPRSYRTGGS